MEKLTVVGIGADGWAGVSRRAQDLVVGADVVVGGARHLAMLPESAGQVRRTWPTPLRAGLPALLAQYDGRRLVALASGDPLLSGVGSILVDLVGADRVEVLPAISSVTLARARMGWSAESVDVVSLVGRPVAGLARDVAPGRRLVVLSADEGTPAAVAELLTARGLGAAQLDLWCNLGAADEWHLRGTAAAWAAEPARLNIVCVTCPPATPSYGLACGLPDDAFEHDGQITRRDLRASALARLAPRDGDLLWDVGAGAGSVAIEWMLAGRRTTAIAIESNPERAQRISRNAATFGVPGLQVVEGVAPVALDGLAAPDAVFIGGGGRQAGLLKRCLDALRPGGRLVAHAVTLETEEMLSEAHQSSGGDLIRITVETAEPLGSVRSWRPARTITQWSVTR